MKLPHFDPHMTFEDYLADPADEPSLTSSLIRQLLSTAPRKVWEETKRLNPDAEPKDRTAFDLGSAAHEYFTSDGVGVVELDFDNFRSQKAKDARDAVRASGKTPILKANMGRVKAMAVAAWEQMEQNQEEIKDLRAADPETSIFWQEDGVTCRARPDFYNIEADVMYHYKTTAVSLGGDVAKFAANQKWHHIAAHYAAAGQALTGRPTRQVFIVQEVAPPHLLKTVELDATFLETGVMRRRRALYLWGRCLVNKMWPGFSSHTQKLEMPEWEERNETDAKDAENEASSVGKDLLDIATRWQALTGRPTRQVFIVQEVAPPHLLKTVELDATFLETGVMRRRRALYLWGRCLVNKMWPGFSSHTQKLEMPEWEERNETDAKDAENEASSVGKDLLDIATRWQAPEDK